MWKLTSPQSAKNQDGVEVGVNGRWGIKYRQGLHEIDFSTEAGRDEQNRFGVTVYWPNPLCWKHGAELSGPEADAVRRLLVEGLRALEAEWVDFEEAQYSYPRRG